MKDKLKIVNNWITIYIEQISLDLIRNLKGLCCRYERNRKPTMDLVNANAEAYNFFQEKMGDNKFTE